MTLSALQRQAERGQAAAVALQVRLDALETVRVRWSAVQKAEVDLLAAVVEARRQEGTWDDIGSVTGMSRQAAWEKWRDKVRRITNGSI